MPLTVSKTALESCENCWENVPFHAPHVAVQPAVSSCRWNDNVQTIYHKYIDQLQKVQRRAARFVCNSYYYKASVTDMLNKLAWESLEARRRRARLVMFYKIQNSLICIPLPSFIVRSSRPKEELPHLFKTVYASTEAYRSSFFV